MRSTWVRVMMTLAFLAAALGLLFIVLILQPESAPAPVSAPQDTAVPVIADDHSGSTPLPAAVPEETVLTSSSIAIHLHRRPRLESLSPPYGPLFAKLQPLAQGGDRVAQYQLGLLLYECRDVPPDAQTLEREIESTYQTRRRGGFDVDDPRAEDQTLRHRYQDCRDVPAAERDRYRDWLKQAADQGLLEAELALPLHLPQGEYCQYLTECAPVQRARQQALQTEAIDYTTRARDAGSAAALWTIGGWYAEGEVLDANDVEAYAHFHALDEINQAAGQPPRFDGMLKSLRGRLRPADLISAEARTRELLGNPNCCELTP